MPKQPTPHHPDPHRPSLPPFLHTPPPEVPIIATEPKLHSPPTVDPSTFELVSELGQGIGERLQPGESSASGHKDVALPASRWLDRIPEIKAELDKPLPEVPYSHNLGSGQSDSAGKELPVSEQSGEQRAEVVEPKLAERGQDVQVRQPSPTVASEHTDGSRLDVYRFVNAEDYDSPAYIKTHGIEHEKLGWRAVASASGHLEYGEYDPLTPPDPHINKIEGFTCLEGDRQKFRVDLPAIRGMSPLDVGSLIAAAELDYRVRARYSDGAAPAESPNGVDAGPRPVITAMVDAADRLGSLDVDERRAIVDVMVHNSKFVADTYEEAQRRVEQWWPNLTPEQRDALITGQVSPWDELGLRTITSAAGEAPGYVDAPVSHEVSVPDTLEERQSSKELPENLALEVEMTSGDSGPITVTRVSLTGLNREHDDPYESPPELISAIFRDNLMEQARMAGYAAEHAEFRLSRVSEDGPRADVIRAHFEKMLAQSRAEVSAYQRLCAGETLEGGDAEAMYRLMKRAINLFTRNTAVSFSDTWADVLPRADARLQKVVHYKFS